MSPEHLKYTKEHEWVRIEGKEAVVGITDHAQKSLGDLVYVELPPIGKAVRQGREMAVVESVKAASDVFAPLSGQVFEVNRKLDKQPELVNQDCYGEGWICKIKDLDTAELDGLMDAAHYEAMVREPA